MCQVNSFECPEEDVSKGCADPTACLYPNPYDKHGFIQCNDGGQVFYKRCNRGLVWNDRLKNCAGSRL